MNKQKSFTLIELLVVIVIIGILAGVIMISTSSSIDKASIAKAQVFSESVKNNLLLNLVSEWKFDDLSNLGKDTWGNNNGILYGPLGTQNLPQLQSESECVSGNCLKFDGTDDRVGISHTNNINFTSIMSAFSWIKGGPQGSGARVILGNYYNGIEGWSLCSLSSSPYKKLEVFFSANGTTNSSYSKYWYVSNDFFDSKWHHAGYTFDSGVIKVYVDGQEMSVTKLYDGVVNSIYESGNDINIGGINGVTSNFFNGLIDEVRVYNNVNAGNFKNSNNLYIGARQGLSVQFVSGLIDDVRIYNAALSSSQIKQNYIAGLDSLLSKGNISKQEYNERLSGLALE